MRVLIATDGSDFSKAAIDKACEILDPKSAEIRCLAVYSYPGGAAVEPGHVSSEYVQRLLEDLKGVAESDVRSAEEQIRSRFGTADVSVTTKVDTGFPDRAIIEEAEDWNADLIVVGSHGRGFWGRLLGSVSNGVVHHSKCSVLVVRKGSN